MNIQPTKLAVALADLHGHTEPKRSSSLTVWGCHACAAAPSRLTVCRTCGGSKRLYAVSQDALSGLFVP
jgi:hypothetical protein